MDKELEIHIQKIRERVSYKRWQMIYGFLVRKPSKAMLLRFIYSQMDSMKAFHYRTQSFYAAESLNQFIKDKNLK